MTFDPIPYFLTKKGEGSIYRITAHPDGPRYIRYKAGSGYRRVRRVTLYHAYHSNFEAAKNWARVDLEGEIKRTQKELAEYTTALDKLAMLHEGDV